MPLIQRIADHAHPWLDALRRNELDLEAFWHRVEQAGTPLVEVVERAVNRTNRARARHRAKHDALSRDLVVPQLENPQPRATHRGNCA